MGMPDREVGRRAEPPTELCRRAEPTESWLRRRGWRGPLLFMLERSVGRVPSDVRRCGERTVTGVFFHLKRSSRFRRCEARRMTKQETATSTFEC